MKIGFFGNTRNVLLLIAQSLQSMGHETVLVVNRKDLLYRPESSFPEYEQVYPEWILDFSQFSEWDYISLDPKIAPVLDTLSSCDVLFLNDLGPSLLPFLNKPAISFLTGSDLTHYANYQTVNVRLNDVEVDYLKSQEGKLLKHLLLDFIQRQRDGINSSVAIRYFPLGIDRLGDALLTEIGVLNSKRIFQFIAELDGINPVPQPNHERVRVCCPVRITWKLPIIPGFSQLDYKGSDIMIRGLGLFYRKTGINMDIVLFRKGLHIAELEQIIEEEGIADQIIWLDEMSLFEYKKEIIRSDIVLEQFAESMVAGVGLDAMAFGRPVIGNLRPELLGDSMPICQAKTPEEICRQLERLVFDAQERERVGKAGREYVEKHARIEEFVRKCIGYLMPAVSDHKKNSNNSFSSYLDYLGERHRYIESDISANFFTQISSYDRSQAVTLEGPFNKEVGFAWYASLNEYESDADDMNHPYRSRLVFLEDGKLLSSRHSTHDEIRNIGRGRYSHWRDGLIFSTTDNSDPNTNGRIYQILFVETVN